MENISKLHVSFNVLFLLLLFWSPERNGVVALWVVIDIRSSESSTIRNATHQREMGSGETRRFPPAAQPEIMRAAEKDEQYASFIYDACRDAFRQLFGTRVAVAYQSEVRVR